jgi:lipoprotein-anchoring transpeptidase ErfK/SrfK
VFLRGGYVLRVPLRSPRLLLVLPVALVVALAAWASPAAAPPMDPHAKVAGLDPYDAARLHGAPIALLRHATVLRATPGGRRLARLGKITEWGSPRVLPALGRRGRWLRVIATELPNGATAWMPMSAAQVRSNPWSVTADLSSRRVTVRKDGRVVRRFAVSVGAADTPTPLGRYGVTDKIELTGGHPGYGCCALALSGHQPNLAQGWHGGDRLAIHGTRDLGTIGHARSLGCLRARDRDARWVITNVFLGTVVQIRR